ncbi:hypothetical protein FDG94_gp023 [Pseudomonas phage SM1]|uniref:Uncharacterized protein n=1 Tax=Pseudomonas phage SM1 TaxID=1772332 RepID=A0A0U3DIT7_9CAUD|nr:hypothetical protein FDG94_gp023 [Pseudomonas phage SM1]ALT58016.1 hypothetical protein SM1_023 [Pseudomonas phage SM1]WDS62547.1 hypothetical protein UFRH6_121 [Pseudomonas phage UF_RH6]
MEHYKDPYFWVCVRAALSNSSFVENWARLHELELPRNGIEAAIDEATGRNSQIVELFLGDVKNLIYDRA